MAWYGHQTPQKKLRQLEYVCSFGVEKHSTGYNICTDYVYTRRCDGVAANNGHIRYRKLCSPLGGTSIVSQKLHRRGDILQVILSVTCAKMTI